MAARGARNNTKSGAAAEAKARRRVEAEERQAKYDALSPKVKLENLHKKGIRSGREYNRLLEKLDGK